MSVLDQQPQPTSARVADFSALEVIAKQEQLEKEARDTLPFDFSSCTYPQSIRQPIYSCRTCLNDSGICSSCSICCHRIVSSSSSHHLFTRTNINFSDHELVELFNRRDFSCDCGTQRMGANSKCSLSFREGAPNNLSNKYDHNFSGAFCFCGKPYDPETETDEMYQCATCEDWIHHSCLFGSPASETSPLGADDFESFCCSNCIRSKPSLLQLVSKYAGREGTGVMLVIDEKVVGNLQDEEEEVEEENSKPDIEIGNGQSLADLQAASEMIGILEGGKRALEESSDEPAAKKLKEEDSILVTPMDPVLIALMGSAPTPAPVSTPAVLPTPIETPVVIAPTPHGIPAAPTPPKPSCAAPAIVDLPPIAHLLGQGSRPNVYFQAGFWERWCRCKACLPLFNDFPYLLDEEETFVPDEDAATHKSTLELGMEALEKLPRSVGIDAAAAYAELASRLKDYLRPLAGASVAISKSHIEDFFAGEKERRLQSQDEEYNSGSN